ncbi:MAG: hypothetical protein AAGA80_21295, partial [Cyanobacteria bacterium P01_F01_bin.143]
QYLATASNDNTARLIQVEYRINSFIYHEALVYQVAFSPDGQYLATASYDNTARLIQVDNGAEIARITHEALVYQVAFSPDGQYLATASEDNTARLNLIDANKLIEKTCESSIQNLSINYWRQYMGSEPYRKICDNLPLHPDVIPKFLKEARSFAIEGNISAAVASYQEAQKFESEIDLNPETEEVEQNPKLVANKLFAPTKVEQARDLAREGKISEAISNYRKALKLDSEIDLNPNTDEIEQDSKLVANRLFAPIKLEQARDLAKEGKISKAISNYKKAQKLDPELKINTQSWNTLCRFGSIYGNAKKVLFACEEAVTLADDPQLKIQTIDSRGLARALTGNIQGAIEDFQAFADYAGFPESEKERRRQWIEALQNGENPFTEEVLEELKNE